MQICGWQTRPPRQRKIGRAIEAANGNWPSGAVAFLDFARGAYMIEGRVYTNPDLAVSVNWAGRTVYMAHADGIDIRGGRAKLNLPPGTYDILQIDPAGGVWRNGISVPFDVSIAPRAETSFVQVVIVFPAGLLSPAQKEALIMPLNVQADWEESDASSAAFIKRKPDVVTQLQLEARVIAEVADAVDDVVNPDFLFRDSADGANIEYSTNVMPDVWRAFVSKASIQGPPGLPGPTIQKWVGSGQTAIAGYPYASSNAVWRALTPTQTTPVEGANWTKLYDGPAVTHDHDDRYYLKAQVYTKTETDGLLTVSSAADRNYALALIHTATLT